MSLTAASGFRNENSALLNEVLPSVPNYLKKAWADA
jgi:hypothetical protein